jgi:hypothetical protein
MQTAYERIQIDLHAACVGRPNGAPTFLGSNLPVFSTTVQVRLWVIEFSPLSSQKWGSTQKQAVSGIC